MLTLEVRFSDGQVLTQNFTGPTVTIGRESGDLVLNDAHLSSRHAQIEIAGATATFRDLGSTNGSYTLEGHRITTLALSVGSVVRLGGCTISVLALKSAFGPAGTMVMNATDPVPVPGPGMAVPGPPPPAGFDHAAPAATAAPAAPPPAAQPPQYAPQYAPHYGAAPGHYAAPPEQMQYGSPPGPAHHGAYEHAAPAPVPQAHQGYGAHAQYGMHPGAAGAPAHAVAGTTPDLASDWAGFLKNCWSSYRPHWQDGAMILGYFSVLPQLVIAALFFVLEFVPVIGSITGILISFLLLPFVALSVWLVGIGALQEYALRHAIGQQITHRVAIRIQLGRIIPFFVGTFVPALVATIGSLFCFIPGVLLGTYLYPAYMVEGRTGIGPNQRSFELLKSNWAALIPLVVIWVAIIVPMLFIQTVLGFIPYLSHFAPVVGALILAAGLPFFAFVVFRVYFDVRRRAEGGAALDGELARLPPVQ